jgi:hypothetical protein
LWTEPSPNTVLIPAGWAEPNMPKPRSFFQLQASKLFPSLNPGTS